MYQFDHGRVTVLVRCPRDIGAVHPVVLDYRLLKNGKRPVYLATCKLDGKTETCERCRSAIVSMCLLDLPTPGEPLTPDLERWR